MRNQSFKYDGYYKPCVGPCQQLKLVAEFNAKSSSPDGYQNVCRICNSEIGKRHYQNNKEKIKQRTRDRRDRIKPLACQIILHYLEQGCIDCGEDDIVVLDFDHLSDKKYNIADMVHNATSLDKLEYEIAKCQVRCANCHRRKTAKERNWWRLNQSIS